MSATNTGTISAGRYVGQAVKRLEDPRLLSGHGRYVDDVQLPGMLHAAFVRSNVARGAITSIDISAALAVEGVRAIYTGADLNPRMGMFWHTMMGPPPELGGQSVYPPLAPLAGGDVRFVGDPIAIVIAENRYIAEDAADLVEIEIDSQQAIIGWENALDTDQRVHPGTASNVGQELPPPEVPAEVDALFADAPHVFTRRFTQCRATNVPMEPRGIVVDYDKYAGDMQIWAATQSVSEWKSTAARLTGLPEHRIKVVANDVGGGFGQKMMMTRDEAAVVMAAHLFGEAPVKWTEDRRESLMAANQGREEIIDTTFAVTADGVLLGAKVVFWEDIGAFPSMAGSAGGMAGAVFPGPYKFPVVVPSGSTIYTNTVGKAPYRGPWMMETVAREQMMDHIAHELGIDPIEIRRRNIIHQTDLPYTTCTTMVYESVSPSETMEQALEMLGVEEFRKEQAAAREQGRLLGMGVAVYIEPSAVAFGIMSSDQAIMRMDNSGKVIVAMTTGNHGQSLETTIPQIVAEHLGCNIEDVILVQGNTESSPTGGGTGGSRSATIAGGSAMTAALKMKDKIVQIAAHMLEASPEDMEVNASVVSVKGTPAKALPFAMIAPIAYQMPEMLPPGMEMGLEVTARYQPRGQYTWSNAAHACTVEIDPETGMTKILRYIVSEDCGRMINPMVVEGQIAGGVVQGIGGVLFENMVYDEDGNPLATTFLDYLIPTAPEVPDIEIGHIETLDPGVTGAKGMGEGGAIVAPPCLANAIHDAVRHLGIHPTSFPLGPSQMLQLMNDAKG